MRGVIVKKLVSNIRLNGYVHHASNADPQYVIRSVKTDHVAIHKGQALRHVRSRLGEAGRKISGAIERRVGKRQIRHRAVRDAGGRGTIHVTATAAFSGLRPVANVLPLRVPLALEK